jgi:hypothetical protein
VPGHGNILHYLNNVPNTASGGVHDSDAWCSLTCPHCGERVNAAVIATVHHETPVVRWLRCQACNKGIVENSGQMAPHPLPGQDVDGLPADVEAAYAEARQTAGVGAFTSCELMCRKILMHVAVDKGADEGKTFVSYIDYLKTTGYITPPMVPWIDLIRNHGNKSTHRLNPATAERATNTLMFTTQLLRLVYEMDHRAQQFVMPTATE